MSDNLSIWNALSRTDPAHTKPFKRAGGFSGTALKPIWVDRLLTSLFGPIGEGWGTDEPSYQLVSAGTDILVYCTVRAWFVNDKDNGTRCYVYGVGGDKVLSTNKYGPVTDDEAFKKAFTDAKLNAFKSVGVGADIHMGQFDDQKYVAEVRKEFSGAGGGEGQSVNPQVSPPAADNDGVETLIALIDGCQTLEALKNVWTANQAYVSASTEKDRLTAAKDARKIAIEQTARIAA